jgi:eukaryotic-like serine/threonine-protein kinase
MSSAENTKKYRWQLGEVAEYDEAAAILTLLGEPVHLEARPASLLQLLLRRQGELVPHTDILKIVWRTQHVSDNVIANAISKLRAVLKNVGDLNIENVPRQGYRLIGNVHRTLAGMEFSSATQLCKDQAVPHRPELRLLERLIVSTDGEVWTARAPDGGLRVIKFASTERRLARLKFEATQANRLQERLGERSDVTTILISHFTSAPYFVENRFGGRNLRIWTQTQTGVQPHTLRLQLIAQAAAAVAAAHSVGVLHHALKPENLLVDDSNGKAPVVSVADFGIERVWSKETQLAEQLPETANLMYVAPELLAGARASVQTDVFALGVLLYQCVLGDFQRTLAPGWERDINDELLRADIAHATDMDPQRRMATAAQLQHQLQTFEERHAKLAQHRAQQARQAKIEAKLARAQARRPWLILAAVALASVALVSFIQFRAAETARKGAERVAAAAESARVASEAAKIEAERYAASAGAVQQFLAQDILAQTDPTDLRYDPKADQRQILDNAAAAIESRFPQDPLARAAMHQEIGGVYKALTVREGTRTHLEKAIELFTQALGASHERTLGARYNLAHALALESKFEEAERLLEDTDQLAGTKLQEPIALAVLAAAARGEVATMQIKPEQAVVHYEKALALVAQGAPVDSHRLEVVQASFADALSRLSRQDEALRVLHQLLSRETSLRLTTKAHIQRQLTRIYRNQGHYAAALKHAEAGLQLNNQIYGPDHFNSISMLSTASYLYELMGDCEKGLSSADEVYRRMSKQYKQTEQGVLIELGNRGSRRVNCGEFELGVADSKQARDQLRKLFGPDNFAAMSFSLAYVRGLGKLGRFQEAFSELEEVKSKAAQFPAKASGAGAWIPEVFAFYRAELLHGQRKHHEAGAELAPVISSLRASGADPNLMAEAEQLQRELAKAAP